MTTLPDTAKRTPAIWISVAPVDDGGGEGPLQLTARGPLPKLELITDDLLHDLGQAVQRVCRAVSGVFDNAAPPDELTLTFSVKVGAKGGNTVLLLTEASGEATLAVQVKWASSSRRTTHSSSPAGATE